MSIENPNKPRPELKPLKKPGGVIKSLASNNADGNHNPTPLSESNAPAFSQHPHDLPFTIEHLSLEDVFDSQQETSNEQAPKPEFVYLNCVVESKKTSAQIYDKKTQKYTNLRLPKDVKAGTVLMFPNQQGTWDKCMVLGYTLLEKEEPVAIEVTPPVQSFQFHHPEASGKPVTKLDQILTDYPEKTDGRLTTVEVDQIRKAVNIKSTQTFRRLT